MSNPGVLDRAAGLLDAAGRDPDGVLSPAAATRSLQAADELHRAGALPVLEGDPMPPVAANQSGPVSVFVTNSDGFISNTVTFTYTTGIVVTAPCTRCAAVAGSPSWRSSMPRPSAAGRNEIRG